MCDVLVAMPDATKNGKVIFGKNSDRPAGECQVLYYSPGRTQSADSEIHCSYVSVPESYPVLATFGCRPYWCWGYETGMNEAGVVGGNAAIFTRSLREAANREPLGLTGMDLLRLGLERGPSAEEAISVIVELLEKYGQWGSAVHGQNHIEGSYDNSFLIADRNEAWILETSGRRWIAERITEGIRSISNEPTIRNKWTKASPDLQEFAKNNGWWDAKNESLDFALAYGDHENYSRQVSHIRWMRSQTLLERYKGKIDASSMMNFLRDHYEGTFLQGPQFHQYLPDFLTLCMHDSPAGFTWGNTATSVVVELDQNNDSLIPFWLCYLPPCSGIYLAYFLSAILPEPVTSPGKIGLQVLSPSEASKDEFSESSLWWRFHRLVEEIRKDPLKRHQEIRALLDPIEKEYISRVKNLLSNSAKFPPKELDSLVGKEVSKVLKVLDSLEKQWGLV
ncbi:MAG: C69 family dipeptidase [bacterium]